MTVDDDVVRRALDLYGHRLSRLPNVVALGIGEIVLGIGISPAPCVAVYVTRKLPRRELGDEDVVPEKLDVDHEQVWTRVIEVGSLRKEGRGHDRGGFGKEGG